jgi:YVTN family beta-propeller protein
MKSSHFNILLLVVLLLSSCSPDDEPGNYSDNEYSYLSTDGVFLVNEGNFMSGNGSLSFYSFNSDTLYNDLFEEINGRPLGDIPNSLTLIGNMVFIVVNNSGKIEVTERTTLRSTGTVRELNSPRNLIAVDQNRAYITSMWSEKIAIIDLKKFSVSGFIDIRRSSEAITMVGNKVFVSCWASGDEIIVIDPVANKVTDSIKVGKEPESMVVDKNQKLWVLCSGGYSGQYYPELVTINSITNKIERIYQFPSKINSPSSLCINSTGDTIYYIDSGLKRMSIYADGLPTTYFVPPSGRMFYKMTVDWRTGWIFATNALDFQKKGYLLKINNAGVVTDSAMAGIIPASVFSNKILQ